MRIKQLLSWFAAGCGLGLLPIMPGTFGSLLAVPVAYGIQYSAYPYVWYLILYILAYYSAKIRGEILNDTDHSSIVCDEVVGLAPALSALPQQLWLMTFIVFRLLDITKPWPIRLLDRQKTPGFCLADDVLAGFFTLMMMLAVQVLI